MPEPVPRERLGKMNYQNSHTNTTNDGEKRRETQGTKEKLQINAWGWEGKKEPL